MTVLTCIRDPYIDCHDRESSRLSYQCNSGLDAGWEMMSASMSCDGQARHAPLLMMTTSGLKRLGESAEEEQINQDLR